MNICHIKRPAALALTAAIGVVTPFAARAHQTDAARIGNVSFPIACDAKAQPAFDRAVALYYNYFWKPALKGFEEVLTHDRECAMAFWGAAIVNMDNILSSPPTSKQLAEGAAAVERAKALGGKTERERDLIASVEEFYRDHARVHHRIRLENYERAMERAHQRHPDDPEIAVIYALALQATAHAADKTYSQQLRSARILEKVAEALPSHPGAQHFLVHAYDFPALARHGLPAARRYARLAADTPHALHMPSHIFTRLGMWQESIESNLRSARACDTQRCELHSLDYAGYAYLQLARDADAKRIVERILAWPSAEPLFGAAHAQACLPARYVLERGDWRAAAMLELPPQAEAGWAKVPHAESQIVYARGLGAARSGDMTKAKKEIERLGALKDAMVTMKLDYWAEQAAFRAKIVAGWVARAEGRIEEAVRLLREAADSEDATEKALVTPGPIAPARELLAEMLLELERPREALAEFTRAMEREPGRLRSLYGAARAAELAGNKPEAEAYHRQIVNMTDSMERIEVVRSRSYLATN